MVVLRIEFGKVDTTWEKYGLVEARIDYNDKPSPYKAIIKDGKLVAILGADYRLIPNEVVVDVGNKVAEEVGAKPFKVRYARTNYLLNKAETRVYANYILPRGFDIEGKDRVYVGFSLNNSIDGTMAFGASGFTFRSVCANGVFMGYKEIAHFYRKHTKKFEVDFEAVKEAVLKVLEQTRKAIDAYRKMVRVELNEEIAEAIAKSALPRKLLPDYIETEKDKLVRFDTSKTLWDVYNSITEKLWHDARMDIDTKYRYYQVLHSVIPVVKA
ncbi:MAG: DUF932 domain-containing protein [Candidatus Caldarchaeum sp.]